MSRCAGIVLAGGRSSRMGRAKAGLEWEGATLLEQTAAVVAAGVDGPVVVVRAPGQELPALPGVELAEDVVEGRGPLEGLAAGLRVVGGRAAAAYVSSTDVPFLRAAFVRRVCETLRPGDEVAAPRVAGRAHPLAAAYRSSLLPRVEELLEEGELRLGRLLELSAVRWLDPADLAGADPELASLRNVNTPADYEAALAARGVGAIRPGCA